MAFRIASGDYFANLATVIELLRQDIHWKRPGAKRNNALLSELKDGQTGRRIGQIIASDLEEGIRPMTVLNECAHDVGDAIARQLRR